MNDGILQRPLSELERVLEDVPIGFCTFDLDFRYVFVNKWLAALNGIPVAAHLGRTIHQVIPHVAAGIEDQLRQVIETGETIVGGDVEAETLAFPGEKRFFQHTYTAITDTNDEIIGLSCLVTDVTTTTRAERAMHENIVALDKSQEQLTLSLEAASIGTWSWNLLDGTHFWDSRMMRMSGLSQEALTGVMADDFMQSLHPDDKNMVTEAISQSLEHGADYNVDYRIIRPDNNDVRVINARALVVRDDAGKPTRMTGVAIDITEQKNTEKALKDAHDALEMRVAERAQELQTTQARLLDAIESISEGFILYDQDDRFIMCNEIYFDFYPMVRELAVPGAKLEDIARRAFEQGAVKGSIENTGHWLQLRLEQQRTAQGTHEQELPDGRWLLCSERKTANGYTVGIRTDITEIKHTGEQLRQAQKMEAIGQLTGGLAHDFNNLLAAILGNTELIALDLDNGDPRIEAVIRAAMRGAELTQHLLAFSRKQTLNPQAIVVDALLSSMKLLLDRTLGETIEISTTADKDLWLVDADPAQLENALLNLAINARDAMAEGGSLIIEATNAELDENYVVHDVEFTPGDYVMIAVSDTGSGMSAEVLALVFEPFYTTKDVGEGSGLGLAMVYGFAKQSRGHVTIYSDQGHGTTVRLYLPRNIEESTKLPQEVAVEILGGQGEKVLVVEDDPDVCDLAVTLLESLNYRVQRASDGVEALSMLEQIPPPDLLLTDVVLPNKINGTELATEAKQRIPTIKILFMSGYATNAARHNGLADSDAILLNKPFLRRELAAKVRRALDQ